jgi:hypothetical protein
MTTESNIRTTTVTRIQTVSNVGNVYGYWRECNDWKQFVNLFGLTIAGETFLRTWFVSCEDIIPEGVRLPAGYATKTYRFVSRGYFGVIDADATENSAIAIAESVLDALNATTTFVDANNCPIDPPLARLKFGYTTWGGALCHLAEITQEFTV